MDSHHHGWMIEVGSGVVGWRPVKPWWMIVVPLGGLKMPMIDEGLPMTIRAAQGAPPATSL